MIDGSKHPFRENMKLTKEIVEYAHTHGVVVEAELGKLAGVEDNIKVDARNATFTDPEEAAEFVDKTGVDSLADKFRQKMSRDGLIKENVTTGETKNI